MNVVLKSFIWTSALRIFYSSTSVALIVLSPSLGIVISYDTVTTQEIETVARGGLSGIYHATGTSTFGADLHHLDTTQLSIFPISKREWD